MKKLMIAMILVVSFTALCLPVYGQTVYPEFSGNVLVYDELLLDTSCINEGYFYAATTVLDSRCKLGVSFDGETVFYDMNADGEFILVSTQFGSGEYGITLYKNIYDDMYDDIAFVSVFAELQDEYIPFLEPNRYVPYTEYSACVQTAYTLCEGKDEVGKYLAITRFIGDNFSYDYEKAEALADVPGGILPEIEETFQTRSGICQDLSAITVAMLRSQGIPAKLVIGYTEAGHHAWCEAVVNGESRMFDPACAVSGSYLIRYEAEASF